jgi:hypothetical protein
MEILILAALGLGLFALAKMAPETPPSSAPALGTGATPAGGDLDAHGCIPSAGYQGCEKEAKCVRSWELAAEKGFPYSAEAFVAYCGSSSTSTTAPSATPGTSTTNPIAVGEPSPAAPPAALPPYVQIVNWLGKDVQGIEKNSAEGHAILGALVELYNQATVAGNPAEGKLAITAHRVLTGVSGSDMTAFGLVAENAASALPPGGGVVLFLKDAKALIAAHDSFDANLAPETITVFLMNNTDVSNTATKGSDFVVLYNLMSAPIAYK